MFNLGLRGTFVGFEARVPYVGFCILAIFTSIVLYPALVRQLFVPLVRR